jgi:hypothetical protein
MQKDYKFKVLIFEIFNQQNNVVQALKIHFKTKGACIKNQGNVNG